MPASSQRDTTFTKLFVGGLPYSTTSDGLRTYFIQFGEIEEAVVINDRETGKSKGYGFVTMADEEGAQAACKETNPIIEGRKANVNLAYVGAKPRFPLGLPPINSPQVKKEREQEQTVPQQISPSHLLASVPEAYNTLPQHYVYPGSYMLTANGAVATLNPQALLAAQQANALGAIAPPAMAGLAPGFVSASAGLSPTSPSTTPSLESAPGLSPTSRLGLAGNQTLDLACGLSSGQGQIPGLAGYMPAYGGYLGGVGLGLGAWGGYGGLALSGLYQPQQGQQQAVGLAGDEKETEAGPLAHEY